MQGLTRQSGYDLRFLPARFLVHRKEILVLRQSSASSYGLEIRISQETDKYKMTHKVSREGRLRVVTFKDRITGYPIRNVLRRSDTFEVTAPQSFSDIGRWMWKLFQTYFGARRKLIYSVSHLIFTLNVSHRLHIQCPVSSVQIFFMLNAQWFWIIFK